MGFRLKVLTPFRAFTRFSTICPAQEQPSPRISKVAESSPFASPVMDAGADASLVSGEHEQHDGWGAATAEVEGAALTVATSAATATLARLSHFNSRSALAITKSALASLRSSPVTSPR